MALAMQDMVLHIRTKLQMTYWKVTRLRALYERRLVIMVVANSAALVTYLMETALGKLAPKAVQLTVKTLGANGGQITMA